MLTVFLASLTGMTYGIIQATRLKREAASLPAPPTVSSGEAPGSDKTLEPPLPPENGVGETPADDGAPVPVSIGKYKLPFGTFLAGSAVFVLFWGDPILRWYASLFRF